MTNLRNFLERSSVASNINFRALECAAHGRYSQTGKTYAVLMLAQRALYARPVICRTYSSAPALQAVPILPNDSLETFRSRAYEPRTPALFPRGTFNGLPATSKWFAEVSGSSVLNRTYLAPFGSAIVPLEFSNDNHFTRSEQSLSFFLECVEASSSTYATRSNRYFSSYVPGARAIKRMKKDNDFFSASKVTSVKRSKTKPTARIYLAQAPIVDLPQGLRDDLPTPEVVLRAGKGDVYDSSIWLGEAPTYTPLHRDPNPNLFVQLAGKKIVRLFRPEIGRRIFARVQEQIGGTASASIRGEEMMAGAEKKALEQEVWGENNNEFRNAAWEAKLGAGDGLFIPKGWWHSVKGIGEGMTGSVCFVASAMLSCILTDVMNRPIGGSDERHRSQTIAIKPNCYNGSNAKPKFAQVLSTASDGQRHPNLYQWKPNILMERPV